MIKTCSVCGIEKSTQEFNKHKQSKDGFKSQCKQCRSDDYYLKITINKQIASEYRSTHKEEIKLQRYNSKEKTSVYNKEYGYKNKEKIQNNRDNNKERSCLYEKDYRSKNKPKLKEKQARVRIDRKQASKIILNHIYKIQTQDIYKLCPINNEVDHIIPINHKLICGLYVPWNLQYLDKISNRIKRNKFDGTYDNISWKKEV